MEDEGLDCLDLLEETPGTLRGLMRKLSHEDATWKPAPDRFSVAEVLAHLSHSEGHCYRMRVDRFLNEEMPEFESDDAHQQMLHEWACTTLDTFGRSRNWCAPACIGGRRASRLGCYRLKNNILLEAP